MTAARVHCLLSNAARLLALVAVARARRHPFLKLNSAPTGHMIMTPQHLMNDPEPTQEVEALTGEVLAKIALGANGEPFNDDNPDAWAVADAAEPELVSLGAVRFKVVDPVAHNLAIAVGAVEAGDDAICWLVEFDGAEGAPVPAIGQAVLLPTDVPGVTLPFAVWATYADLNDPSAPDLGPDADRNPPLEVLEPNQALLVLVKDAEDVL